MAGTDDQEESYDAYLVRERKESAHHYLKPFRRKFWVCWGLLAAAGVVASKGNFGLALVAKSQIPEKEVSAIVEQQIKREFSDWSNLEIFRKDRTH